MTQDVARSPSSTTVPLRAVVEDADLGVTVIAESLPPGGLDTPVRWAHVSELRDPGPYLLGEELLLTAGVHLPTRPAEIDDYVRALLAAGISALGFGVTPPMHDELPVALRRTCVRHGLPLVVIPHGTPFLAITRAVALAVHGAQQRDRRAVTEARAALTDAAGSGPASLVRELADRMAGWAALIGSNDAAIARHRAPQPLPHEVGDLLQRLRGGRGHRAATTELPDGTFVVAQPVYPMASASELLVVGRGTRVGDADRTIIAVAAALCGLVGRADEDAAALGAAATSLLLSERAAGAALEDLLGAGDYRLLAGITRDGTAPGYGWLRTRLGTPLLRIVGDRFTAIGTAVPGGALRTELHDHGWLTATSAPQPAAWLPHAQAEIEVLLDRARSLGRPVVAGDSGLGLSDVVPRDAAAMFARRALAPLVELDRSRDAKLCETLRAWLARHGSWDRTAQALGIHRNSVRHRIRQVERALGIDLADTQIRMELWFALQWLGTVADQYGSTISK